MKYRNVTQAVFLSRPNRFVAQVLLGGQEITVHVKNTGRCRELLVPGCRIWLERGENPSRKTAYDLVAVYKGERLINMDSQAPNQAAEEWVREGGFLPDVKMVRREVTYKNSRFDLYLETANRKIFMEVKGVTLEENGVVLFPDAPTQRGVKHVEELMEACRDGYEACILFVVQMKGVKEFRPNGATHPEFAAALSKARESGVKILAYDCQVTPDSMKIDSPVKVKC